MVPSSPLLADLFGLNGQVAIVTGGMGRLGGRYTQVLAQAGASVAVFDLPHRTNAVVEQAAEHFAVSTHQLDVTNRAAVDAALRDVGQRFGTATILINNAGLGASPADRSLETGRFEQYPESAWEAMLASHLKSALVTSQSFIAQYRATSAASTRSGSIINVSSTYGLVSPDQSVYEYRRQGGAEYYKPVGYSVAKSGVLNFTRWLAEVLRAARPPREHARPRRSEGSRPCAGIRRRVPEAYAAWAHGGRRGFRRRTAVSRVTSLGLHDRRYARRGRRLDGQIAIGSCGAGLSGPRQHQDGRKRSFRSAACR